MQKSVLEGIKNFMFHSSEAAWLWSETGYWSRWTTGPIQLLGSCGFTLKLMELLLMYIGITEIKIRPQEKSEWAGEGQDVNPIRTRRAIFSWSQNWLGSQVKRERGGSLFLGQEKKTGQNK